MGLPTTNQYFDLLIMGQLRRPVGVSDWGQRQRRYLFAILDIYCLQLPFTLFVFPEHAFFYPNFLLYHFLPQAKRGCEGALVNTQRRSQGCPGVSRGGPRGSWGPTGGSWGCLQFWKLNL